MSQNENEPWAANIAFVGDEKTVQEVLEFIEEKEAEGKIKDVLTLDGPFDSMQLMLKRRKENLMLEARTKIAEDKDE